MKKYVAMLLAVLLLLNVGVMSVLADETDPSNTETTSSSDSTESSTSASETESTTESTTSSTTASTTESTTASTAASSTTGSTAASTTTTTGSTAAGFSVRVQSVTMISSRIMEIVYTSADGSAPTSIVAAGKNIALDSVSGGKAIVAQSKLPFGTRSATLVFAKGSVPFSYTRTGTVDTLMQISVSGKNVVAYLYDKTFKLPVANASISLTVGERTYAPQKTNSDGTVTFNGVLPSDKAVTVKCVFDTATIAGVTYNGATGTKQVALTSQSGKTTTSAGETTETTLPTAGSHTAGTTNATVYNTLTTAVEADAVWTDVIVDTNLLSAMGMSDYSTFAGAAKVKLSKQNYDDLAEAHQGAIFAKLEAATDVTVDAAMLEAAMKGNKDFAGMKADSAVTVPFHFALQAVGTGVDTAITTGVADMAYTVTVPVPETMADARSFAVALVGSNALYELHPVTATNGTLTFTVNDLDNYALIGFAKTGAVGSGSSAVVWIVLLYVLGALLILGAVVLLLWPILWPIVQKKFFPKNEEEAAEEPVEETDENAESEAEEQPTEEEVIVEETVILLPPIDDFPAIPVEKKEPVIDVSLGDFSNEVSDEKSGIDIDL
ncbi:MAG: hypothetical protein IJC17_06260 [Clostridia bacterium]|nr:hypothetical protein [Clostridia bacterium]